MSNVLSYFRKKITNSPYSNLLTDKELLILLNEKFKSKELIHSFINVPLENINIKLKILSNLPFYKEEINYINKLIENYKKVKIFDLESLVNLAIKIEDLTQYLNELYSKSIEKQNVYDEITPLLSQITIRLNKKNCIKSEELIKLKEKLSNILESKTFKTNELKDLLRKTKVVLEDLQYNSNSYKPRKLFFSFCVAFLAFSFCSYKVSLWVIDNYNIKKEMKEIKEVAKIQYTEDNGIYKDYLFDVNFDELKSINEEVVGYLKVKGTDIDYPFVQTTDNDFYLSHSFNKQNNDAGWVFLDFRNDIDILNYNTIIYAHGRIDGTMFGTLKNTLDNEWFMNEENHIITTVMPNKTMLWQVFSTYAIETENYYIKTSFTSHDEHRLFIDTLKKRSVNDFSVDVSTEDTILTLSTCYNTKEKVVLHAKLIYEK